MLSFSFASTVKKQLQTLTCSAPAYVQGFNSHSAPALLHRHVLSSALSELPASKSDTTKTCRHASLATCIAVSEDYSPVGKIR